MKGVVYDWRKGLVWKEDVAVSDVGDGKVLVKVRAAGINPVDYKLPALVMHGKGVGLDFCGVVEKVGEGVTGFAVGDEVFGNGRGGLAEFIVADARKIAKVPKGIAAVDASAMTTTYLTAIQALRDHGFKEGMKVLIIGASGGCGTAGVQIAKGLGAGEIVGICSDKNKDLVLGLGADKIVDYTCENAVTKFGEDYFDFVYDTATNSGGGENYVATSEKVLKPDGTYVAINGPPMSWIRHFAGMEKAKRHLIITNHKTSDLEDLAKICLDGNFKPVIDSVLPFNEESIKSGFERLKSRRAKGKIIFAVDAALETEN